MRITQPISTCIIMLSVFLLTACVTRPSTDEIQKRTPDCENAEEQLKMLDEEMVETHERIFSGVRSVLPTAAVYTLLVGEYGTNYSIATGDYEEILDAKIIEIKEKCNLQETPL